MVSFVGKVAIITGGASGIGKAIGEEIARRGACVVLADRDGENAERAAQDITQAGGRARAERVDVRDAARVQALVDGTFSREGRLDFMFNNAGIALFGEVRDMTLEQWERILQVNLHGVVNGVAAAYSRMAEQGSGHIVNTASVAGIAPTPGATAYAMTKHGVVGLSTSLRGEAAALGVKVSVVCPGLIDTPLKDSLTYLNLDKQKMLQHPAIKLHAVEHCARVVVRGVERNRAIITVTPLARRAWWLYRLLPQFSASWLGNFSMQRLRREFSSRPENTRGSNA
jgi:NAD(P)-dependent dehydrogenase (short-subunit alcohol dehydrogenase family)